MTISPSDISRLREQTGAGVMDVKKALEEAEGDFDKATEILRKSGALKAQKKAERVAREGIIFSYIHGIGKIGVLLELNCETDFVAKTDDFKNLASEIAMQIAAMNPLYIKEDDIPAEVIAKEREIAASQVDQQGKPSEVIEQILNGKMAKYFEEVVLLNQPHIKDPNKTIKQLLEEGVQKFSENIQIGKFARFSVEQGSTVC